jgi:hypothetical protein
VPSPASFLAQKPVARALPSLPRLCCAPRSADGKAYLCLSSKLQHLPQFPPKFQGHASFSPCCVRFRPLTAGQRFQQLRFFLQLICGQLPPFLVDGPCSPPCRLQPGERRRRSVLPGLSRATQLQLPTSRRKASHRSRMWPRSSRGDIFSCLDPFTRLISGRPASSLCMAQHLPLPVGSKVEALRGRTTSACVVCAVGQ